MISGVIGFGLRTGGDRSGPATIGQNRPAPVRTGNFHRFLTGQKMLSRQLNNTKFGLFVYNSWQDLAIFRFECINNTITFVDIRCVKKALDICVESGKLVNLTGAQFYLIAFSKRAGHSIENRNNCSHYSFHAV